MSFEIRLDGLHKKIKICNFGSLFHLEVKKKAGEGGGKNEKITAILYRVSIILLLTYFVYEVVDLLQYKSNSVYPFGKVSAIFLNLINQYSLSQI